MRIPCATYRLQFNAGFGFQKAQQIVDYLADLGITDLYASPIFNARQGSIHGYDVVDPTVLNPEIGTEKEFRTLVRKAQKRDMGWLQDIVPNHMAFDGENKMLMDVLEKGGGSEFYDLFDIEWDHAYESMKGRLLAPFLGKSYAECLESGEITLDYAEQGFCVHYYSLKFPLRIESYARLLAPNLSRIKEKLSIDDPDYIKFMGVVYMIDALPCRVPGGERSDQIRFLKRLLWEVYEGNRDIRDHIRANLDWINRGGDSGTHNELDALLYEQFFRLSFWKVASEEINYRRFFSINELISLRMRDFKIFDRCHTLILRLIEEGAFTGLRIDHIDGLYDPRAYLQRLRDQTEGVYVTVEKILALDEPLPENWPVYGTSGYDFMNYVNGIFCRKEHKREFDRIYTGFVGTRVAYDELLYEKKGVIIERFMTGDVDNLAHLMKRISSKDRGGGDITLYGLKRGIHEMLSAFPVYRTYISADSFTDNDRKIIEKAFRRAEERNPDLRYELNTIRKYLLLDYEPYLDEEGKKDWLHFVMRFQQFTGPLMAKGFEDTTLYVYNRLISLNEVGGEPYAFGISLEKFHGYCKNRFERWPHAMNATATHDTKRGEDVRARINVLSEIPGEWEARIRAWREMNRKKKKRIEGMGVPSRNDEYFLYQTLVGAYPFEAEQLEDFPQRIKDYLIKAIREAKVHTGWIAPDAAYEGACLKFVDAILTRSNDNPFLNDFLPFQKKIAHYGILNSLSQTLIKITAPGVPDFYQGTELWELSLVDPDNRRPVDYKRRKSFLADIQRHEAEPPFLETLLSTPEDGKIKLYLTLKGLKARYRYRSVFERGAYLPLEVEGRFRDHVVAFARVANDSWAVTVAPRFTTRLVKEGEYPLGEKVWSDTRIRFPGGTAPHWQNVFSSQPLAGGETLQVGEILSRFPVALLLNAEERH